MRRRVRRTIIIFKRILFVLFLVFLPWLLILFFLQNLWRCLSPRSR
jgi:hypothetical protein